MRPATSDPRLRQLHQRVDCLFFDCDGILFDSNAFKRAAMMRALADYGEGERRQMEDFWRANGGLSRFAKFDHFFSAIAHVPNPKERAAEAIARFGEYSRAAYRNAEPVGEAFALARAAGPDRCFVTSGAAQAELESVFAEKDLARHFGGIFGSPTPKLQLVEAVLQRRGCGPERAALIGDGAADFRVCQALGMHFVYVAQYSEWTRARETLQDAEPVSVADDFRALLAACGVAGDP